MDFRLVNIVIGGLCFAAITELAGAIKSDPLMVAIYSFSICLPLSVGNTIYSGLVESEENPKAFLYFIFLQTLTMMAFLIGAGGLFFHFSQNAGMVFVTSCFAAGILLIYTIGHIAKDALAAERHRKESKKRYEEAAKLYEDSSKRAFPEGS